MIFLKHTAHQSVGCHYLWGISFYAYYHFTLTAYKTKNGKMAEKNTVQIERCM